MTKVDDQLDAIRAQINEMVTKVIHVSTENTGMLAQIEMLRRSGGLSADHSMQIDAMVTKAQGIQEAISNLALSIKAVDDLVPDAAKPQSDPPAFAESGSDEQPTT